MRLLNMEKCRGLAHYRRSGLYSPELAHALLLMPKRTRLLGVNIGQGHSLYQDYIKSPAGVPGANLEYPPSGSALRVISKLPAPA